MERRAIQLGLRGEILKRFHEEWIQHVTDITDFVKEQHQHVLANKLDKLMSPAELVYIPSDPKISGHIRLTGSAAITHEQETSVIGKTDFVQMLESLTPNGACCSELLTKTCQGMTKDSSSDRKAKQGVIVCLGGAFNPVHTHHVQLISETINWIKENTQFYVVAARLGVAPDGYVKTKCRKTKQKCMKAEHRIRLCELACKDHDLIKPYKFPVGSALDCGERVKKELSGVDAKIAVICGADRAMTKSGKSKWNTKSNHVTICVGRKGTDIDEIKEALVDDLKLGIVKNPDFYVVEKELDNVSSTEVREALAKIDTAESSQSGSEIITDIVTKGWITEPVGNYILENYESLYLDI